MLFTNRLIAVNKLSIGRHIGQCICAPLPLSTVKYLKAIHGFLCQKVCIMYISSSPAVHKAPPGSFAVSCAQLKYLQHCRLCKLHIPLDRFPLLKRPYQTRKMRGRITTLMLVLRKDLAGLSLFFTPLQCPVD